MPLTANNISFRYKRRAPSATIEGLSLTLVPDQVTMLLGPNGAGKSTLLKLMSGYLRPESGEISYNAASSRGSLFRNVAWMPQSIRAMRGMKVLEQAEYSGWLAGHSRATARKRAKEALEMVDLADQAGVRSTELSGGQLRRLGLAQALTQGGEALLMDEPTAGLDPEQSLNFRSILRNLEYPGGVLLSTHQASDVVDDIHRIAVMNNGRVRYYGTVSEFESFADPGPDRLARAYSVLLVRE